MPCNPAARTRQAAGAITAWLETRRAEPGPPAGDAGGALSALPEVAAEQSRPAPGLLPIEPAFSPQAEGPRAALVPAHTDWLHHHLQIEGPAESVEALRRAAAGAGTIPWQLDFDRMEEDFFHRLVAPPPGQARTLSLDGARMLAAELRDAVARRHALATARVGRSQACPFDLHALLPVPADILRLGPDHPDSLDWLWTRWGTTQALRHVALQPALPSRAAVSGGSASLRLSFWSADWTPWRALAALRAQWPALRFTTTPRYELA